MIGSPPVESSLLPGQCTHAPSDAQHRLLRHDLILASNVLRVTFAHWPDRLLGAFMLIVCAAGARSLIASATEITALWVALAIGIIAGLAASRTLHARLAYQESGGLLAADALRPRERLQYAVAGHGLGLLLLVAATLVVRPSLLLMSVPGYVGGTLVAQLHRLRASRLGSHQSRATWAMQAWSRRPVAGLAAAALLMVLLLPARTLPTNMQMALAGSATLLIALMLSRLDDTTVRFMASAGFGFGRLFTDHAKGLASFLAAAVAASWAVLGTQGAAVVSAASGVALLLFVLRILAYRLLERRGADLFVSVLLGVLMLVTYSFPPALPVITILMLWQLHRHGHERRWLIQ